MLFSIHQLTAVDEVSFGRQCERERTEKGVAYQCEMKVKKRNRDFVLTEKMSSAIWSL